MIYENVMQAVFLSRPNRFLARVLLNGNEAVCHVKNTGRLGELLIPGVPAAVQFHPDAMAQGRKTEYSLIAVKKETAQGPQWVNIDSQAPNPDGVGMAHRRRGASLLSQAGPCKAGGPLWGLPVRSGLFLRRLSLVHGGKGRDPGYGRYGHVPGRAHGAGDPSPGGPCAGRKGWIRSGRSFCDPDEGRSCFFPHRERHLEFADALKKAKENGVHIWAYDCAVTDRSMKLDAPVPVIL